MLHCVNQREFKDLTLDKERVVNSRLGYLQPLLMAISTKWIAQIEPTAVLILLWLAGRTLAYGKAAEQIPYREFIQEAETADVDEVRFAPLPLSMNTLKKHIDALCDADFLTIYSIVELSSGAENRPRMFEINVKKLVGDACFDSNTARVLSETGTPLPNHWGGSICINTSPSEIENKEINNEVRSARFAAPRMVRVSTTPVGETKMLAIPKKMKVRPAHHESIDAVIAAVSTRSTALRTARVAAVESGEVTVKSLQALLDKTMRDYLPGLPRLVVTQKPFSVFCKRVQASNINLATFVPFAIREWQTLAAQNRTATLRGIEKGRTISEPLPPAPSFSTMAYRLPYFIAAFANNMTRGGRTEQTVDHRDAVIASLTKEVQQLKRSTPIRIRPAQKPILSAQESEDALMDDWVPPKWESAAPATLRR